MDEGLEQKIENFKARFAEELEGSKLVSELTVQNIKVTRVFARQILRAQATGAEVLEFCSPFMDDDTRVRIANLDEEKRVLLERYLKFFFAP